MKLDDTLQQAVMATIAEKILLGLDTSARDAILAKSITDALTTFAFKNTIESVVAERTKECAVNLLKEEQWTARIIAAVQQGFDQLEQQLPKAVTKSLLETLAGSNDGYSAKGGSILKHIKLL